MGGHEYLYVKNWTDLQHYTKRNPPWIKLYRRLLKEGDFLRLSEFEQWQLVRIWLVSAEEHPGGWVPNDQSWLRRYTGTLRPIPLAKFVKQGWLEQRSASDHAIALASNGASTDASNGASNPEDENDGANDSKSPVRNLLCPSESLAQPGRLEATLASTDASALLDTEIQRKNKPLLTQPSLSLVDGSGGLNGMSSIGDEARALMERLGA